MAEYAARWLTLEYAPAEFWGGTWTFHVLRGGTEWPGAFGQGSYLCEEGRLVYYILDSTGREEEPGGGPGTDVVSLELEWPTFVVDALSALKAVVVLSRWRAGAWEELMRVSWAADSGAARSLWEGLLGLKPDGIVLLRVEGRLILQEVPEVVRPFVRHVNVSTETGPDWARLHAFFTVGAKAYLDRFVWVFRADDGSEIEAFWAKPSTPIVLEADALARVSVLIGGGHL